MKILKKLAIPVLLLTVLSLCVALVSCKKDCEHEFGEWSVTKEATCTTDGEQTRTCSLCNETETKVIKASHESNGLLCGACGETIIGVDSLLPTISTESLSSFGVVIKDVLLSSVDNDSPEYDSTTTIELAELVVYLDENGELKGYADGEAVVTHILSGDTTTVGAFAFLDGETIYVTTVDPEGYREYAAAPLSTVIEQNPEITETAAMLEALLPTIETWLTESLLPCFTEITLPEGVELPELNESTLTDSITALLDLLFTVENTDDGAVVALDLSIIKEINDTLNEKTVAQLIDLIGGEGTFLQLQALIPSVLNFTARDLITFVSYNLGVDVPALLESLDELAVIITGSEEATFEMLVGIEADIEAILADEELLATSVKDIIMSSTDFTTEDELNAVIAQIIGTLSSSTLYQLLEVPADEVAELNGIVDMISEMLSYEITVGADGKFVSSALAVNIPNIDMYITATLTAEKLYINLNDGEAGTNNVTVELIPGYTPNPDAEKEASLKAHFDNLPAISEEIIESYNALYLPIYDNDVLVGVVVYSDYAGLDTDVDSGLSKALLYVEVVDLTALRGVTIYEGCGSKAEYEYEYASIRETRIYTYDPATVDMTATNFGAALFELVLNGADYDLDYSESDSESIYFYYDSESGELVEESGHDWSLDEEKSISSELVDCGEKYYDYYVCESCGEVEKDTYVKEHGDGAISKSTVYDEATATYSATFTCECGEVYATNTYTVLDGSLSIFADEDTLNDEYPEIYFNYTVTEAGRYRFYFNSDCTGYVHIYQKGHMGTPYFGDGFDGYVDLYLEVGSGRFAIYFYGEAESYGVSFGIDKID